MPETRDQHRALAKLLFNRVWDLLEKSDRTTDDDRTMLAAARASRLHWWAVGTPRQFAVSDWQVSRVLAVLGDAPAAAELADASLWWCRDHDLGPFLEGYAHEALARAAGVGGETLAAESHWAAAEGCLAEILDGDEREMLEADLQALRTSAGP